MKINCKVKGSGENIVLLHGWMKGASLKSMGALQAELVEKGFKVWALDLPGFGESEDAPSNWGVAEYAQAVAKFIKENIKGEFVLAGHSFGGSLAAYIAARGETKPSKLVLISSSGLRYKSLKARIFYPFAKGFKLFLRLLPFSFGQKIRRWIYYYIIRERDYVDSEDKKEQFISVTNQDLTAEFQAISIPTLLIWGKDDKMTPLSMAYKLNELVPSSRLEIIEGRHGIPMTAPQKIADLMNGFLKD